MSILFYILSILLFILGFWMFDELDKKLGVIFMLSGVLSSIMHILIGG